MTETICRYAGDRDQAIVSYLLRRRGRCRSCRTRGVRRAPRDVRSLPHRAGRVRGRPRALGAWSPPRYRGRTFAASVDWRRRSAAAGSRRVSGSWREIPPGRKSAAALLCLGVGAGIANLDVRYDADGLQVRTGWSAAPRRARVARRRRRPPQKRRNARQCAVARGADGARAAASRRPARSRPSTTAAARRRKRATATMLRRVRALVDESERRQQRELALRVAEAMREVNAQRQADLVQDRSQHRRDAEQYRPGDAEAAQRDAELRHACARHRRDGQ